MTRQPLTLLLASPRGFCAGVERAVLMVEETLRKYGPPVYVRHEIVHNRYVVSSLEAKGAVFVDELDAAPDNRPVVFSAHGVPRSVQAVARARGMRTVDATCPLVTKVHREAKRQIDDGRQVLMIGHRSHPEVVGTMGQAPEGRILLVQTAQEAETVAPDSPECLAYVTQTTLSVDDAAEIIAVLRRRFPAIEGPRKDDICYATTNRQHAVKAIAGRCDALIVLGAPNSCNSVRLVEVAARAGCPAAFLVRRAAEIDWEALGPIARLGISAGASAPEALVDEAIAACRRRFEVTIEEVAVTREEITFKIPQELGE